MRICCIASSLAAGGAERVLSLLANQWAETGRSVTILTLAGANGDAYELSNRVVRLGLGLETESHSPAHAIIYNARKIWGLRGAVASLAPDVVISFVDRVNVLALLACVGKGIPVIVSERVHPAYHDVGRIWSLLRRLIYRRADALVVQSEAIRLWAENMVPAARIHVVPNPVGKQFSMSPSEAPAIRRPIVLAVGRLVPQKGFDVLIRAFRLVVERHSEWSLAIVGQGPEEAELRRLATELLPVGAVVFPGAVRDPERHYRTAGVFVLPSRFEGFPNALVEAMACGCAVIATTKAGGDPGIIEDGVDGVLVPPEDVGSLARALGRLISDSKERYRLAERAVESAKRFRLTSIMPLWEHVISNVRGSR